MLIDTHCHLQDKRFAGDLEAVLDRAQEAGVAYALVVGSDLATSREACELAQKYPQLFAIVGVHPHDSKDADRATFDEIRKLAAQERVVALGEMGLDYHYDFSPRKIQQRVFRYQIGLARELGLPIVIHDREAHADTMAILKEEKAEEVGGVLHCYSGSWEMARECIKMGFYISIAGPVTFANAKKLVQVVENLPLEHLLVETDAPYLTPVPHRGKRNEPAYVRHVAEAIARIKGIAVEEVEEQTTANAIKLFGLPVEK
ncbi:MAG: TatD family hydrolase [bacterium]|jgi:TatD DNase family protein|nr:TatD family hydrolase [Bacillota bacterium]HHW55265.1 TatD family hydrolase [Bacillota bacterium]